MLYKRNWLLGHKPNYPSREALCLAVDRASSVQQITDSKVDKQLSVAWLVTKMGFNIANNHDIIYIEIRSTEYSPAC
jgi:ABC-type oligopeptide transport system substrate-binding subunit